MRKTKKPDMSKTKDYILVPVIGCLYTAMGTCGMTDGIEVKGTLTKLDQWGAYLTCEKGIPHLCNKRTLNTL